MGLNVSTTMGFENKELLRSTARNILESSGATSSNVSKIIDQTIFEAKPTENAQLAVIKASSQISLNKTLCATLKYLKTHAGTKVVKTPTLGELWKVFSASNESSDKNRYESELYDFEVDLSGKNIFAAA